MSLPAGCVYLVPVPIGNLGDITLRALETLKAARFIACEDTRKTRFLLNHYQIKAPRLLSLHKYNEKRRSGEILDLLSAGDDLAVVADAGSPGISDPAQILIREAVCRNIKIVPLPGATALIPALTASGLAGQAWQFLGFLPLKLKDRRSLLERIRAYPDTTVLYEAPHRLKRTLEDLLEHCGNRPVCLAREISKLYEEFIRCDLAELLANYDVTEKGEFVILVGGPTEVPERADADVSAYIAARIQTAASLRSLAQDVADRFALSRNRAYQMVLAQRSDRK